MFYSKYWNEETKTDCKNFLLHEMKNDIDDCEDNGFIHPKIFKKISEKGYFDSIGNNFKEDFYLYATVLKEIAKVSGSLALSYHINYLSGYAITTYIKDSTRQSKYLDAIKKDGKICAFALTEPMHGSDISNLDTKITSDNEGYNLSGIKKYIVNGVNADYYIVAGQKEEDIYTVLIDREENGDKIQSEKHKTLGVKGSGLGLVTFNNAKVQKENLLGTNIKDILKIINFDRIGSIIMALGMAEAAFEKALIYIRERRQFGKSIADFQGIQFIIAEMTASLKVIDHLVDLTVKDFRNNEVDMLSLAINKAECTRLMEDIVSKSIDIMGGSGYLEEFEVERIYRDSKSVSIGGGTKEVLKNLVGKQMVYKYKI